MPAYLLEGIMMRVGDVCVRSKQPGSSARRMVASATPAFLQAVQDIYTKTMHALTCVCVSVLHSGNV
jgi:hypothetical protein